VSAGESSSAADAAMNLLQKAVGMGYSNLDAYRTEDVLDPLCRRTDIQLLLMDLAFLAEPFVKGH
jgi:hypothetical protein